jgi:uncharacterized protein (TIGR00288 family)
MNNERAMAFVDFENINIVARNTHNVKYLDFIRLRQVLSKDFRCVGCLVYLPNKMRDLVRSIQNAGLKPELVSPNKSVDGRLIFDVLTNAHNDSFDIAIIASGDRDYIPVIEEVKRMKKQVIIASFSNSLASSMKAAADGIIDLDQHITELTQKMFQYECSRCKKKFELPFKLYPDQLPICRDCKKSKK